MLEMLSSFCGGGKATVQILWNSHKTTQVR